MQANGPSLPCAQGRCVRSAAWWRWLGQSPRLAGRARYDRWTGSSCGREHAASIPPTSLRDRRLVRSWRMADSRWWKDFDAVLGAAVPAGSRILDIGCGDGGLVDRLAELGFDAIGVDPAAPPHRRLVQQRVEHARRLGEFDALTAVMSLHHVLQSLFHVECLNAACFVTAGMRLM
jgi:2-polyprenyl-3-methyl-5-hydroxy-6-metoxy-1,4-benzoquinol methylase